MVLECIERMQSSLQCMIPSAMKAEYIAEQEMAVGYQNACVQIWIERLACKQALR